jgi:hypothetical protein
MREDVAEFAELFFHTTRFMADSHCHGGRNSLAVPWTDGCASATHCIWWMAGSLI